MDSKVKEVATVCEAPYAQRESVRSGPEGTDNHKNPKEIRPVGNAAAQGGNFN